MVRIASCLSGFRSRFGILFLVSFLAFTIGCEDQVITEPPITSVDDEFDAGSGIEDQSLTTLQVRNLTLLGKVWGFAKYHHPAVMGGTRRWDYDLFRAIQPVLAASDLNSAAAAIVTWLDSLGAITECTQCAEAPSEAQLLPDNAWVADTATLGATLSGSLLSMFRNRPHDGGQRYVTFVPGVGNPDFSNENAYASHSAPDAGYRILALFRFWNIIQYWFPYRDVMDEDWDGILREFIPDVMEPMTSEQYRLAMLRLTARVHDSHANAWSEYLLRPPTGTDAIPVFLRFVEDELVVWGYSHEVLGPATGLAIGDVIESIDEIPVETLVDSLRVFYGASNEATLLRDIARSLTKGTGPATLTGYGASGAFELTVSRVATSELDMLPGYVHDLLGPTFQMLDEDVAYLKLSSVATTNVDSYIQQAESAEVFVIDIRNYPNEFVVFSLGGHLVSTPAPFVRFTQADPTNPGAFLWGVTISHTPIEPTFNGKVVILVDEVSQSQAEYTAMAFRAAPDAIVVGSTTAGADGNVSRIPLPGDVESMISGIGVFYPDGTPTQRVGIVPDLVVLPTIAGIRQGRDEVLEAAVSYALGRDFTLPTN